MDKLEEIELLGNIMEYNPEALIADGFNESIIGVAERCGAERCGMSYVVVYDIDKIIETLMDRDGMSYEEAYEYYVYNIVGSYMGENTPIFLNRLN